MKRLIASLALLGAVLFICWCGINYVTTGYEKITEELTLGEKYMEKGDFESAKKHCERAEKLYTDREQYMSAFVNHGILDEIGQALSAVAPLADKDSIPEFYSMSAEAKTALTHLRNDHIFMIGNLF